MNILVINHDFLFKENLLPYEVLQNLRPDWDFKVVVPPRTKMVRKTISQIPDTFLELHPIPTFLWQKPQIHLYHPWRLRKILTAWIPDLVHLNQEPFNFASLEILKLLESFAPRPKFVVRSSMLEGVKVSTKIEPIFRWVEKKILSQVDGVECINNMSLSYIRKRNPKTVSAIIPWSRDPGLFSPGPDRGLRAELGLNRFTVGYFGNLTSQKDLPTLFKAVSLLKEEGKSIQILIIGDGPEKLRLEVLGKKLGLGRDIVWHPPVVPEEIVPFYRCLDAFALCSRTEGHSVEVFGRVLIEAMATGIPVIGSNSGAIPEVVGDGGLIFPEGDAKTLADLIKKLMRGQWPAKGTSPGRTRFLQNYTHSVKAELLNAFFMTVMSKRGL